MEPLRALLVLCLVCASVAFECDEDGIFADVSDDTCRSYIICSPSTNYLTSGLELKCNTNSAFDPEKKRCVPSSEYACRRGFSAISSRAVTYQCTTNGRFPDPAIANCKGYVICALLPNSTFAVYHYECSGASVFNPTSQECSNTHVCSLATTTPATTTAKTTATTTAKPFVPFNCTAAGTFHDPAIANCKGYVICVKTPDDMMQTRYYTCPEGKIFDKATSTCSSTAVCNSNSTSTPNAYDCTQAGYFPYPEPGCKRYILCVKLADDTLEGRIYNCSAGKLFDPISKKCRNDTVCNPETYKCSAVGNFADPDVSDCKGYVTCIGVSGGTVDKLGHYLCPANTAFNPNTGSCSDKFVCKPTCNATGNFPDPNVDNCRNYMICGTLANNTVTYLETRTCPGLQLFDPKTKQCSSSYVCNPKPTRVCTSEGTFSDPSVDGCRGYVICSKSGDGTFFISGSYLCPTGETYNKENKTCSTTYGCPALPVFKCNATGKYPDSDAEDCRGYKVCMVSPNNAAEFQVISYTCANASSFNPTTKKCEADYVCHPGPAPHVCTVEGVFADPTSNCKGYLFCIDIDGTLDMTTYLCDNNLFYDPVSKSCSDSNANCGKLPGSPQVAVKPTCNDTDAAKGYPQSVADPTVPNCKGYITCLTTADVDDGLILLGSFNCSGAENFEPTSQMCIDTYVCPSASRSVFSGYSLVSSYSVLDPTLYDQSNYALIQFLLEYDS